jgi:hypothetical protein
MTLGELSDLAQVIGAIGIIVSILYLAVQIRQNTRALRLSVHHAMSDAHSHYLTLIAQDADLARLYRAGAADFAALSEEDRSRFDLLLHHVFITFEDAYYHLREGALPGPLCERLSKVLPRGSQSPAFGPGSRPRST